MGALYSFQQFSLDYPWAFIIIIGLFGAIVGSFLNVVIYRLPVMLEKEWRAQAKEILSIKETDAKSIPMLNLTSPSSHCPHCKKLIKPWNNIPVLSYLFLGGKCANCKGHISLRYPLIELISALAAAFLAWFYGFEITLLASLILIFSLIALFMIDFDHQLLPDQITLPLLWVGLLFNIVHTFASLQDALIGAVLGYLVLWSIYWLFKWIVKKEGMGYGDFKLLACFGAWLGWQYILLILLLSSVVGIVFAILLKYLCGQDYKKPFAFGPSLIAAGLVALFFGNTIMSAYLQLL